MTGVNFAAASEVIEGASVLMIEAGPRVERWRIVENYRINPAKDNYMVPYPPSRIAPHPQYASYADVPPSAGAGAAGQGNRNVGPSQYHATSEASSAAYRQSDAYYPSMLHDTTLGAPSPNNLIMVLLTGIYRQGQRDVAFMPSFSTLTDDQLASLVNYIRPQFGSPRATATAQEISSLRASARAGAAHGWTNVE